MAAATHLRVRLWRITALAGAAMSVACARAGEGGGPAPIVCPADADPRARAVAPAVALPPPSARFDYQLGAPYPLPSGVDVVVRDRGAEPASGAYNVCYVNAFQTQPEEDWSGAREDLVLHDAAGRRVRDPDWPDEYLLDFRTVERRSRLTAIVGGWLEACRADGFDAVELDNLDSFTRAPGLLSFADTFAYAAELLALAHGNGLAVAQKNTAEASHCLRALGFDFAVAEECWQHDECDVYGAQYGARVYDVEYELQAFEAGCRAGRSPAPILRDRDLLPPGSGHVRRQCP